MPLFSSQYAISTQTDSSWDTYLDSSNSSTNYHDRTSLLIKRTNNKNGTHILRRVLLAFDLSDQVGRRITSATLSMRTISGFGMVGTVSCTIGLWEGQTPVYDEADWSGPTSGIGIAWDGAATAFTGSSITSTLDWPRAGNTSFTSGDLADVLNQGRALETGDSMVFLVIKQTDETVPSQANAIIGHDEDVVSAATHVPTLTIVSEVDHRKVFKRREMVKFMNKSVGIKGKSSVPSLG